MLELPSRESKQPDIHIVYGRNEAGKSTISNAIMDFLYGFPSRSRYAFMHGSSSLEIAASIQQGKDNTDKSIHLHRLKSQLRDHNNKVIDATVLDKHNLSRQNYESRFWVDDSTLHEGGESILNSKGELGAALFAATTGLNTLTDQLNELMIPTDKFFKPGRRTNIKVKELKDTLKEVQKELKTLDTNRTLWNRLQKLHKQQLFDVNSTKSELQKQRELKTKMLTHKSSLQKFKQWRIQQLRLNEFNHLADLPTHWYDDVQNLRPEYLALSKNIQLLTTDIEVTTAELSNYSDTNNWHAHQHELEQLKLSSELFSSEQKKATQNKQSLEAVATELLAVEQELKCLPNKLVTSDTLISDTTQSLIEEHLENWKKLTNKKEHLEQERSRTVDKINQLIPADSESEATKKLTTEPDQQALDRLIHALDTGDINELISRYKQNRQMLSDREQEAMELDIQLRSIGIDASTDLHTIQAPSSTSIRDALDQRRAALSAIDLASEAVIELHSAIDDASRQLTRLGHAVSDEDVSFKSASAELTKVWNIHKNLIEDHADFEAIKIQAKEVEHSLDALNTSIIHQLAVAENFGKINSILDSKQESLDKLANAQKSIGNKEHALQTLIDQQNQSIEHLPALTFEDSSELLAWREALDSWRVVDRKRLSQQAVVDQLEQDCQIQHQQLSQYIRQVESLNAHSSNDDTSNVQGYTQLAETLSLARATAKIAEKQLLDEQHTKNRKQELSDEQQRLNKEIANNAEDIEALENAIRKEINGSWLETTPTPDIVIHWPIIKQLKLCIDQKTRIETELGLAQTIVDDISTRTVKLASSLMLQNDDGGIQSYHDLIAFHDQQKIKHAKKSELIERRDELSKKLSQLSAEKGSLEAHIDPLHDRLGTKTLDELQSVLNDSHERQQLVKTQVQLENDICELRSVDTFEAAMDELESFVGTSGTNEHATQTKNMANAALIDSAFNMNVQEIGALLDTRLNEHHIIESNLESTLEREQNSAYDTQNQLNQMGSDERVAILRQKEADLIHEIEDGVMEALKMRLGLRAIERGLQHFRDRNRSGMLAKAKASFITLTENSYVDLVTRPNEKGVEQLIATRKNGATVTADNLSMGTRYQLYLALRIAAYHEYRQHRTPLPFIADDIFETFDEARTRSALAEFAQMALHGQVIYFTHHRHVADIAQDVVPGINTIELN